MTGFASFEPSFFVLLGWLGFGGTHVVMSLVPIRSWLVDRWGEKAFVIAFSAVALLTMTPLVTYYSFHIEDGARGLGLGRYMLARWLLGGIAAVGVAMTSLGLSALYDAPMPLLTKRMPPPTGIGRITRHPFFVGMSLAAIAHVFLVPTLAGVVFFGGFAGLSIFGGWHQDRKRLALVGEAYREYMKQTSAVPFWAIVKGPQTFTLREISTRALLLAGSSAAAAVLLHDQLLAYGGILFIGVLTGISVWLTVRSWQHRAPDSP